MQVILSGSSPLIQYSPCRACEPSAGWQAAVDFNNNYNATNGTDTGFVTTGTANVPLTPGTGIKFDMAYAATHIGDSKPPGAPGSGMGLDDGGVAWNASLLVNGTAPPSTATIGKASVQGLPAGTHQFTYVLTNTGRANNTWAQVQRVVGTIAGHVVETTTNTTIDDTAWKSGQVVLSPGWNMLELNGTKNTLDEDDYNNELQSATRMFNNSVSWTTQPNASTTVSFDGSAVWACGMTGGDVGRYQVLVDGVSQGTFNGAGGPRSYNRTMFFTSGLTDGPHTLQLINQQGRLSLDRFVATKGLAAQSPNPEPSLGTQTLSTTAVAPPPTAIGMPSHAPSAAAAQSSGITTPQLVGAIVGPLIALILLIILLSVCLWRGRSKRPTAATGWSRRPWYKRCLSRDKGWRFAEIDEHPRSARGSTSSFGSTPTSRLPSLFPRRSSLSKSHKSARTDRAVPMSEVRPTASPDPMAFALNNGVSPLSEIQRSYGEPVRRTTTNKSQGTWSDWFGLSTYGGRMSMTSKHSGKSGAGLFGLGSAPPMPPPAAYSRTRDRIQQEPPIREGYPPSPQNRYA